MRKSIFIISLLALSLTAFSQTWTSHFAYDPVITQIAVTPDRAYAVSGGSLFSVDIISEKTQTYDRLSGLHFSNIQRIAYDSVSQSLLIVYNMGHMDIISDKGITAVEDYFLKDIVSDKYVNNITFHNGSAYLATEFGILRFKMDDYTFMECCVIGDNATEIPVQDIIIEGDSIYAKAKVATYSACIKDNILDYRFWHPTDASLPWSTDKGTKYTDNYGDIWEASNNGLIRIDVLNDTLTYIPNGPAVNYCYRIRAHGNKIGVLQGSYGVVFGYREGLIMMFENNRWHNYTQSYMKSHIGRKSEDYCDIAFDPNDPSHFFVASFGYGLFEFRDNEFYKHYHTQNSALEPKITGASFPYIWVDGLRFDNEGNLWMLNNCPNGIKVLTNDSTWVSISNDACYNLGRTQDLIISNTNNNIKILSCLNNSGIGVMDDNGTIEDQSDDRSVYIGNTFVNNQGESLTLSQINTIYQTHDGVLWIGTETGLYHIDNPASLLEGNRTCCALKIALPEEDLDDVFGNEHIQSIAEDSLNRIWIGTNSSGLFCVSEDKFHIVHHYTTRNSPLLSNDVKSLYISDNSSLIYIGTANGFMTYQEDQDDPYSTDFTDSSDKEVSYGSMKGWTMHFSSYNITAIEDAGDAIYGIADGSVVCLNKETEEMSTLSKSTGLHDSDAILVAHNHQTNKTLLLYKSGLIDIISKDGEIVNMPDLFLKSKTSPTTFYNIYSHNDRIYICSELGIINVNMRRNEIAEAYVLRDGNKDVSIHDVCVLNDSIYAASDLSVFTAALSDNLMDYSNWKILTNSTLGSIKTLKSSSERLYLLSGTTLQTYFNGRWSTINASEQWLNLYAHNGRLIGSTNKGLYNIDSDTCSSLNINFKPNDILRSGTNYWLAEPAVGLVKLSANDGTQVFETNSPYENLCYRLRIAQDKLLMLPGGYFVVYYERPGNIMMRENGYWKNYTQSEIAKDSSGKIFTDFCDAVIDPADPSHFYVASFGYGLVEFKDNKYFHHYSYYNTTNGLESVIPNQNGYTWVDGLCLDSEGNLWMLNNSVNGVKVLLRNGQWVRYSNIATNNKSRTKDLLIWNQDPNIKVLTCAMSEAGVGVFNDKGTITNTHDDKAVFVSTFTDQQDKKVTPQRIYSMCQKADGAIWVGTESGIIILPDVRKLLNGSNTCQRIIIPRNDGTGLGDYLLGEEQINCMAVDGGNRIWIGTENSGLYLVSEDGQQVLEHFTNMNSPLVSNSIISLAIHPSTGEVFIGTSIGLMSYQSDASEPKDDLSTVYAYPNPVYRNYEGYITITGLMENTVVNIVDEAGNLVCKTRSNGGMAVWDGRDATGKRALPGVYTALCNAEGKHNVCKILILHASR